jgi:hypothetical protein
VNRRSQVAVELPPNSRFWVCCHMAGCASLGTRRPDDALGESSLRYSAWPPSLCLHTTYLHAVGNPSSCFNVSIMSRDYAAYRGMLGTRDRVHAATPRQRHRGSRPRVERRDPPGSGRTVSSRRPLTQHPRETTSVHAQHVDFLICASSKIQATLPMLALAAMVVVLCGGSLARIAYHLPTLPVAAIILAWTGGQYRCRKKLRQSCVRLATYHVLPLPAPRLVQQLVMPLAGHESSTLPASWLGFAVSRRRATPALMPLPANPLG